MSGNPVDTSSAEQLLFRTKVQVSPETYVLVCLSEKAWSQLLENQELSPRENARYMVLRDGFETTLLLEETDWKTMRHAARDARFEGDFRLVTLDIELGWNITGYIARVTGILAAALIPCGVISAFSRDHLLIKQGDLSRALLALGPHVAELC